MHLKVLCIWTVVLIVIHGSKGSEADREIRNGSLVIASFNCKDKPVISRFPDLTDCSKFIYCVSGSPYPGLCPSGMRFNVLTSRCDLQKNVPCGSDKPVTNSGPAVEMNFVKPVLPIAVSDEISASKPLISVLENNPEGSNPESMVMITPEESSSEEADQNIIDRSKLETTTDKPPSITTTTQRPQRLQDEFKFQLDCKNKHPCGLYPNTNGDCTTFSECATGERITKHCNGGQLFDTRTLECQEPSKAQCWQEPDNGPYTKSAVDPRICSFHQKPEAPSYQNTTDGIILTNPLVTNIGSWLPWVNCPAGSYAQGIYVWRRLLQSDSSSDQAGVVSIRLNCQNPDGSNVGFVESVAPGAPIDIWPSYYTCKGVGIGMRLNSQKYLGPWPADNLGTDNVQLICSCGPPVYKPYELIPGAQQGNRGDWTDEQICKPGQAVCAMQTQMAEYRERVIGSYDNAGLNNMHMKCCDVPNPAVICKPIEKSVLIRTCENTDGIYPRRCDFESSVGLTYDYTSYLQSINFHESVGFSIQNSSEELRTNFETNLDLDLTYQYNWNESKSEEEAIWQVANETMKALYLDVNTKVDLYQIVGICGHFVVRSNRFFRNVTDLTTGDRVKEYFEV